MTDKQKRFCQEYLIDCNAARAYRAAYPQAKGKDASSNGCRLLKKAEIREYIQTELEKLRSEKIADAQEVLEYLTGILRSAEEEAPGGGKRPDEKDRLKAAELLGKQYGLYGGKSQTGGALEFRVEIDYGVSGEGGNAQAGGEET